MSSAHGVTSVQGRRGPAFVWPAICARAVLCCCVLSLLLIDSARSSQFLFDTLKLPGGLTNNRVTDMIQDPSGVLWLATENGLVFYDGDRAVRFTRDNDDPNSLAYNELYALAQSKDGLIWIGTDGEGLNVFDPKQQRFTRNKELGLESLVDMPAYDLLFDADQQLWITSQDRVIRYNPVTRTAVDYPNAHIPSTLYIDVSGTLWLGGEGALFRFDPVNDRFEMIDEVFSKPEKARYAFVSSLAESADGALWIGINGAGVRRLDPQTGQIDRWEHQPENPDSLISNLIHALLVQGDQVLVGTYDGLDSIHRLTGEVTHSGRSDLSAGSLNHKFVYGLFEDRDQIVWVATYSGGLQMIRPRAFDASFYLNDRNNPQTISSNNVHALATSLDQQSLLLGSYEGTFDRIWMDDGRVEHIELFDPSLAVRPRIWNILQDASEHTWLGTSAGLYRLDAHNALLRHYSMDLSDPQALQSNDIWCTLILDDGTLLVGTAGGGISIHQPLEDTFRTLFNDEAELLKDHQLGDNTITDLIQEPGGRIWIGTYFGGLYSTDSITAESPRFAFHELETGDVWEFPINHLHLDADNRLWVASRGGGIYRISPDRSQTRAYRLADGLPSDFVRDINEDPEGRIWISTDHGLARLNPDSDRFEPIRLTGNWQGRIYNTGAFLRDVQDRFWLGSQNGVTLFDPQARPPVLHSPAIHLSQMSSPQWSIDPHLQDRESFVLSHQDQNLTFEFNAIQYFDTDLIRYQYRLEGLETTWNHTDHQNRTARYTNLSPGRYQFQVRAQYASLPLGPISVSPSVTITAPPWLRPTAWALYVLLLCALVLTAWTLLLRRRQRMQRHHLELASREQRLNLALWASDNMLWEWNRPERRIYCPQLCERTRINADLGWMDAERYLQALHPEDRAVAAASVDDHQRNSDRIEYEARVVDAPTGTFWVQVRGKVIEVDSRGYSTRMIGTLKDVTDRKQAETELRLASRILENLNDGVAILDLEMRFVRVNRTFERITGYCEDEVIGIVPELMSSSRISEPFRKRIFKALKNKGRWTGEYWSTHKNSQRFLCQLFVSAVQDDQGSTTHYVAIFSDITTSKQQEEDLRHLANYDSLTSLPNRTLFTERLNHASLRAQRKQTPLTLIVFDLKQFKNLNESMGHLVGDMILLQVAERLTALVDAEDTVARLRSDEFAILLESRDGQVNHQRLVEDIFKAFERPIQIKERELRLSPSIGISSFPDHCESAESLLRNAYSALYRAKEGPPQQAVLYQQGENTSLIRKIALAEELATAVTRGELSLEYQPKIDPVTRNMTGIEALIRWDHPTLGSIRPDEFIPIAEQRGLIFDIGQWVIESSVADLASLKARGFSALSLAINVSPRQTENDQFILALQQALDRHDISANLIQLELTEGLLLSHGRDTIATLEQLREMGVRIVIDDFGTGYSSLSYLNQLPIDHIKIDKSFVFMMETDRFSRAIILAVIRMAESLDLAVTAEGVENEAQLKMLTELGCHEVQGYLIASPLTLDALIDYIATHEQSQDIVRITH